MCLVCMAQIDTGNRSSRNVTLEVVPFIDLMSCLTAFLLVTAVWIPTASVPVEPRGATKQVCEDDTCDQPKLSVLVEHDEIWLGISRLNEFQRIPRTPNGHDWSTLEDRLRAQKASSLFADTTAIEIAAHSTPTAPTDYQALVATMDVAIKAGFHGVGITEPRTLSARPTL